MHTLFGPDHYLPFIVLSKARNWTITRTIIITVACGIGHVASSIVIGSIGVIFGIGLNKLEFMESIRGDWAAWALFIFGLVMVSGVFSICTILTMTTIVVFFIMVLKQ